MSSSSRSSDAQGAVSEALSTLLRRQVDDRGVVVWYDPQKAYGELVKRVAIADCVVLRREDGYFRLRQELEPFLECVEEDGSLNANADIAPRVLVYVPIARAATGYALIEVETAGVVVEPDAVVPERNSRLGRIVEEVFRQVAPAKAAHLARQAEDGLLTVEELDRMAGEAETRTAGALQIVFGAVSAEEILLQFSAGAGRDAELEAKSAVSEIVALVESEFGLDLSTLRECQAVRSAVVRHLLVGDLLIGVGDEEWPEALAGAGVPQAAPQRDMISRICHQWRNRTDLKDAYADAADRVEEDLGLARLKWSVEALGQSETFSFSERLLLDHAVALFLRGDVALAAEWAVKRGGRFWASERPAWQLAWRVIESAGGLVASAEHVCAMLRHRKWSLDEIVDAYALHADPWMQLDRLSRDLECRHARWEAAVTDVEMFEPLVAKAREIYATAGGALAETYAHALRHAGFKSDRHALHVGVFQERVVPALSGEGKTAFFMVDALRYEMAVELVEGLMSEFQAEIAPALGSLPGITPVGMAALLPHARKGISLAAAPGGAVVAVEGTPVTSRVQRLEWLAANAGVPVCCSKLADALKPAFRRRKEFMAAKLVVVTSQEIDLLGEEGDEEGIRIYLVDVLEKLRRALRVLAKAGVTRFIIAADHGFIYAPGVDPGLTMDAPGGKTAALHARVWVGEGGVSGEGFFRVKASDLGLDGTLELAFPHGMGSFRIKGGGGAYFHGGVSPAENVLPVVHLTPIPSHVSAGDTTVRLLMSKTSITNRLFSVTVEMSADAFFVEDGRRCRFELLCGQKDAGRAATAAYGFEDGTGEVVVKPGEPNVVTFMLNSDVSPAVTIRILDCQSQIVLDVLKDVPVKLGM